jgi:histidine triad (HIT) family protein
MTECIFCKIVQGIIPATKRYESDTVVVFDDVTPQAPTHVLVVPKHHISNVMDLADHHPQISIDLMAAISSIATTMGIRDDGFRVVTNTGDHGGQSVSHLHFHVLGGRFLTWPPG